VDGGDKAADVAVVPDGRQVGALVEVRRVVVGDHVDRHLSAAAQLLHRLVVGRRHLDTPTGQSYTPHSARGQCRSVGARCRGLLRRLVLGFSHSLRTRQPTRSCSTVPTNMAANSEWHSDRTNIFINFCIFILFLACSLHKDCDCKSVNEKQSQNILVVAKTDHNLRPCMFVTIWQPIGGFKRRRCCDWT